MQTLHDLIALRQRTQKHEDLLTAGFWVVEALDTNRASAELRTLCLLPGLCRDDADLAQLLATKLGQTIAWRHLSLNGDTWGEGRGDA